MLMLGRPVAAADHVDIVRLKNGDRIFYWSLNGFDSFDGDPPAEQKQNDFGIGFTLGWKF